MKGIVLMMAVLLVGGLLAGSTFALDGESMAFTAGAVSYGCNVDVSALSELSVDYLMSISVPMVSGFNLSGGAGLSDGAGSDAQPKFCTPHWYSEPCGTCNYWSPRWLGKIVVFELWCAGVRVYRSKRCNKCAAG